MPKRQRERKKEEAEYKEPEPVEVPKIPYFDRLRREQKIEDRNERIDVEEEPEVTKFPTESVRRKSYSLGLEHDGEKWVRRRPQPGIADLEKRSRNGTLTANTSEVVYESSGSERGVIDWMIWTQDNNFHPHVQFSVDGVDIGVPPANGSAEKRVVPADFYDIGGETPYFKLINEDVVNDEYTIMMYRSIHFFSQLSVVVENASDADRNIHLEILLRRIER